jgi:hypothetical protein
MHVMETVFSEQCLPMPFPTHRDPLPSDTV